MEGRGAPSESMTLLEPGGGRGRATDGRLRAGTEARRAAVPDTSRKSATSRESNFCLPFGIWRRNDDGPVAMNSGDSTKYRIAPAVHDLAVGQLGGQRRLEPRQ